MSTSETRPNPVPVSVEAKSFECPRGMSSRFAVGALIVTAAAAGVVVLAALTSWWALFALLALCPLLMMVCGLAMMTAMRGPRGSGLCAAGPCTPWRSADLGRATWAD